MSSKLILVIGATGAQGAAVTKSLVSKNSGESYRVRAFTRNVNSPRAKELEALGNVELYQGSMYDLTAVEEALQGCYGVFVNIDGFSCGEQAELFLSISIFEIAKRVKGLKHYVFSNLDYMLKKGKYDPQYHCGHYDAKGRVAEWLQSQESDPEGLIWSVLTIGPYMDMLYLSMFAPIKKREDGTYVFAAPIGDGHIPMIALADIGYYARYVFDHRKEMSKVDLEVASDMVSWSYLVETFSKVTGKKAEYLRQSLDEWFGLRPTADVTLAIDLRGKGPNTTFRGNFSGFWAAFRDDIAKRDMEYLSRIHPKRLDLESWMRSVNYGGDETKPILKGSEDVPIMLDQAKIALL